MPRYAPNKMPPAVKKRFFELIRAGARASVAAREVGVSVSCGSVWFVDAGRVHVIERPISPRYLSQDDRIEIADGLRRGESVAVIADRIGKSFQTVYREIRGTESPTAPTIPGTRTTRRSCDGNAPSSGDLCSTTACARWSPTS